MEFLQSYFLNFGFNSFNQSQINNNFNYFIFQKIMQNPYFTTAKSNQANETGPGSLKYDLKNKYASTAIKRDGTTNENNTNIFASQPANQQPLQQMNKDNSIFQGQKQFQSQINQSQRQSNQPQYSKIFSANNSIPASPHLDRPSDRLPTHNQSYLNTNNPVGIQIPQQYNSIFNQNPNKNQPSFSYQRSVHGADSFKQSNNNSFLNQSALNNTQAQNYHVIAQQKGYQQLEDAKIFNSDPLISKAEKTIEQIKENSNILQNIVEKRRKIFYDYDSCLDKIDIQKKKLNQCSKSDSKQFFQQKTSHELLLFKDKKQELVKIKDECLEMIGYYEKLKQKGLALRLQKYQNTQEINYQQDVFEFESMYLRIQDEYQSKTTLLEELVENYKKHFKFDKTSEKFTEKQQQLSMQVKEIENSDTINSNLSMLIDDFLITLKALIEEVEENIEFNEILLSSYQESFNYVQQILFYRNEKIPELDNKIKNIRNNIQQYLNNRTNRSQQASGYIQLAQKESQEVREQFKKIKKQAKQTHSSQNSMFFIQLRSKQITKLVSTINDIYSKTLDEVDKLVNYISQGQLANDELYCQNIINNGKQLLLTLNVQQSPEQGKVMLQKTQVQLSLLLELQDRLQNLSQQSEFSLINPIISQMSLLLSQQIAEIKTEQQKIFPLIKYENETREFRMKRQEIQQTLEKAKEIINFQKQNFMLSFQFEDNQKQFLSILQVNLKLQQYQKLLNQLLQFFQNSRQASYSPFDPQTITQNSQDIHQLLSAIDYNKTNIHLITTLLESCNSVSPTSIGNLNFQVDSEKNKLSSNINTCLQLIYKSYNNLENLRQEYNRPNYMNKVEQVLLKKLISMQSILVQVQNIFVYWLKSGDEITSKVIHLRKNYENYQHQYIDQRLYDIIQDNLEELDLMIQETSIAPELQDCFKFNIKSYTECLVRYAVQLERKVLNPYSANYLINWLEKNYQNALSSITYLFDMDDLIWYQQGNDNDDIGIQLKLLRSRLTESLLQQQSLGLLFNQQNIIANIKLDLLLQVVLKDSILYDYRAIEQLLSIGKLFNLHVRQSFEIRRVLEEKYQNTLSLRQNQNDLDQLVRILSKYQKTVAFNLERREIILKSQVMSDELKRQVLIQADKNQSMLMNILNIDQNLPDSIMQMYNFLKSYVKILPFLNNDSIGHAFQEDYLFDYIFNSSSNISLRQALEQHKQAVEILLDGNFIETVRQIYFREKEIVDRIKLDKKLGLFEYVQDCQIIKDLRSNIDLIKWREIIQKSINLLTQDVINSIQAQQIQQEFSRINQLNRKQQIFVNKFIMSQTQK
ncbi:hypothetical protein TTHERM_00729020 (macronuclear) [Tetrahymena thermophila SB210]|uniref:Uncharacterized protein n=1 Tax=Tetrahymena thermophila (strain SB210) TaxID=312017 RepID=I7M368_TETTS|nr:hypothetical protein TTHERM_00729020 [Tetrahymena thermophila SB210]EAS02442.2 hypothetical protein TTHERM_00729020 [Tetrahymena thermophila SB210]|eukprot:XP_001022687.2 hypothetical protein TTHERM_00729020 [Tetrahymena thermophila SB210]